MEEIKALRLKEKILLIKLKAIQDEIAIFDESLRTTVNSEQDSERINSESIPCQTAKGKEKSSPLIPVALEKSKNKVNEELQSSSSPVANGSGKGISNPLIADSLLKTDKVSLRPSYAQIITEPESPVKSKFYVIFDGEHRGIYEDWSIVSKYVTGKPFPHKKFGSFLQAQQEATRYSAEFGKKEIPLKVTTLPLPIIKKKERIIEFKKTFSSPSFIKNEEIEEEKDCISLDEFRMVWSKARSLCQTDFESEHIYTEDKATKSVLVFCPGSNPNMISLAFSAGLIKFIYPSPNLLEISLFSEGMKKAIKNFRKKIAVAKDANIFIKCTSTLPDWFQGGSSSSYHHLEIGIAKARTVNPSKVMTEEKDPENWVDIRTKGFLKILNNLQKIKNNNFTKVNFYSSNCIITSYCGAPLSTLEKEQIKRFEDKIVFNQVEAGVATRKSLCSSLAKIIEDHKCDMCTSSHSSKASTSNEDFCFSEEDTRELDPTHGFID